MTEVHFSRPFELEPGRYVTRIGHKPGVPVPAMWTEGDYLFIGTGHRLHLGGGLVQWVKH